ncbi:S1-C subfamily serine protease [Roseovarius sp. MBR-51]
MLKDLQRTACAGRFQRRAAVRQQRLGSLSDLLSGKSVDPNSIEPMARQQERARLLAEARPALSASDLQDGRRILEAVVGRDDRLPRSFLVDGARTADAVCRVATLTDSGQPSLGSGFAVAPGLILTNNHVLPDWTAAARGQVEFGYWSNESARQNSRVVLALDPGTLFLTDVMLDFTLVAFEPNAAEAAHRVFGSIDILPDTGKALIGEALNVIQHGDGEAQTISLRDNVVVDVFDDWIHYTSDTSAGASGAPVLNDQWQLAALHHAAFEHTAADGRRVLVNEGVRISSIAGALARMLR